MKRRIVICLGLLLALCLVGDVVAMFLLKRSIGTLNDLATSYEVQFMRAELAYTGIRIEKDTLASLSGFSSETARHDDNVQRFRKSLTNCTSCHHEPEVQEELDDVHEKLTAYQDLLIRMNGRAEEGPNANRSTERLSALADELGRMGISMSDQASRHIFMKSNDAAQGASNAWWILSWSLVAVLISGGVVAFHLKSRMTRPVEGLLQGIERVRGGDLSHRISVKADEEFCSLADAFNQAYEELKKAQESIFQAEKMATVGKMAAGVAHEVGNPLASISSIVQMMRRSSDSEKQAKRTDLIMEEVKRISRIIQNLLTYSKPPAGQRFGPVDIADLIHRATTLLKFDKRAASMNIQCELEDGLKPIHGDLDRLLSVFTNIILNASDAIASTGRKDGTLIIRARRENDHIVVRCQDNGPGMNAEQLANAFEPFYTTKEPGHGTGLGLWICYQVIHRHGGAIHVQSSEGNGTTVTVELTCHSDERDPIDASKDR